MGLVATLDKYTLEKLARLVRHNDSKALQVHELIQSGKLTEKQNSNKVLDILQYIYNHPSNENERYPGWLFGFLKQKSVFKKEKLQMFERYSAILKLHHIMMDFKDENNGILLRTYTEQWNTATMGYLSQRKFCKWSEHEGKALPKLVDFEFPEPPAENLQDIKKLVKLRQQYISALDLKKSPPDLQIVIAPNMFGEPPAPQRVFNKMIRRLEALQDYYKKNQPVSTVDMDELNKINLLEIDGYFREAYVDFLNAIFVIKNDSTIEKSAMIQRQVATSKRVESLYQKFYKDDNTPTN